jgi:ketosteroid isomerase-like protein
MAETIDSGARAMSESKNVVQKFFDTMCSGDFEGGFAGMTADATWSVIGTTGVSGTLDKAGMLSKQVPMLASFKEPPVIGIDEMIAEGDRVVVLAHCKGVGPTGPPVRVMSKAAAIEYAERGVRVNSIYPGMTDTPQLDNMLPEEREMIRTSIPMKRIGRPEEIANVSLFLCSDEASYVTGAEVVIDGGLRPG